MAADSLETHIFMGGGSLVYPSREQAQAAFDAYTAAVGRVAYSWNFLHERLRDLFTVIVDATNQTIPSAIWHSRYNDRAQRLMLEAAINASAGDAIWSKVPKKAKDDLIWLLNRVNEISNRRDDAIHAPCVLVTDSDGSKIASNFFSSHRRAKNLVGKELLVEFDWFENYADILSIFTHEATHAFYDDSSPWPDKPAAPNRRPKKALRDLPPQSRKE